MRAPHTHSVIKTHLYKLEMIDPFGISRGTQSTQNTMLVQVDGGWGEAACSHYYRENADDIARAMEVADRAIEQYASGDASRLDFIDDVEETVWSAIDAMPERASHPHKTFRGATKAAIDMALFDRLGKQLEMPLYRLFGRKPVGPLTTSFTIGLDTPEVMLRKVDTARAYSILKIKLGRELKFDLDIMREIRREAGDKVLRVDANGGWSLDEARQAMPVLADLGVEYVEQPLEKGEIAALRELKKNAPLPIFVDEDSMTSADLPGLVGAVDGINIKLMKSGGLVEARRMLALARVYDMRVMIGCMIETSVAITAAAHLAAYADNLDLDGNLLVKNDPFTGVLCAADGTLTLPDKPGLGVEPKLSFLES